MPKLVWTRTAQIDVQRVYRFLAPRSPLAAQRAAAVIHESVRTLERFPLAGRPVPELGADRRELLIPFGDAGYVLLYRHSNDEIELLALRHQREAGY